MLGAGDLTPPPGVRLETQDQKDLFRASLEFERLFVSNMMKEMQKAARSLGGAGEEDGSLGTYRDMANDQMVQALLDGGGLGLASVLYQQIGEATGIVPGAGAGGSNREGGA